MTYYRYDRRLIMETLILTEEMMEDFIDFFNKTMKDYNLRIEFIWEKSIPQKMQIKGLKQSGAVQHHPDIELYQCKITTEEIGTCSHWVRMQNTSNLEYDLITHIYYHFIYNTMQNKN